MREFLSPVPRLLGDRSGVTALEYGMMAALIAAVIVVAVTRLGATALSLWGTVSHMSY